MHVPNHYDLRSATEMARGLDLATRRLEKIDPAARPPPVVSEVG